MPTRGKTIVYFDNSNIFHGQNDAGWRIDPTKLQAELEKPGDIWQVYFFAAVTDPHVTSKRHSTKASRKPCTGKQ